MILSCPSCGTRYLVDPAALGALGRVVRCARCQHEWHERPPEDLPRRIALVEPSSGPANADPNPFPEIPSAGKVPALPSPPGRFRWLGWAVAAAVVAALGIAAASYRQQVVASWPPAARLYSLVGMETAIPVGLEFRNLRYDRTTEGEQALLQITGEVVNSSAEARPVPRIRIALLDGARRELLQQTTDAVQANLAPGAVTAFDLRLTNPPSEAVQVAVTFAKAP
jgi:predicted Zn finger-like uncharacterized protein